MPVLMAVIVLMSLRERLVFRSKCCNLANEIILLYIPYKDLFRINNVIKIVFWTSGEGEKWIICFIVYVYIYLSYIMCVHSDPSVHI